jgi:hypothetical protein
VERNDVCVGAGDQLFRHAAPIHVEEAAFADASLITCLASLAFFVSFRHDCSPIARICFRARSGSGGALRWSCRTKPSSLWSPVVLREPVAGWVNFTGDDASRHEYLSIHHHLEKCGKTSEIRSNAECGIMFTARRVSQKSDIPKEILEL